MSDTPPDRKEAGDAPAAPRNPCVGYLGLGILSLALYLLGIGPVWWLVENGYLRQEVFWIYSWISQLPGGIQEHITNYMLWWSP